MISKEQACLLELIKASLFDLTSVFHEDVNWEKVFEIAKFQCIVPLLASHVPEVYRSEWLGISSHSKAHYIQLLYEQNALGKLFDSHNIPFFVFKGTASAIYFPVPSSRTFGDIDFYVSEEYFDSAKSLLEDNGYHYIENNDRHYSYVRNGISFELHNRISRQGVLDIDHIVTNDLETVVKSSIGFITFPCLPMYKNGLILLWHMAHHLKTSGIGLRQIIDWMMFVHIALDDFSWENHFRSLAADAGMEKLAITVTLMCKRWLGLPNEITWCNKADENVADQLLIWILNDGNFGHNRASSDSIMRSIKEEGAFKYLQRSGMSAWPLAQKCAFFRAFAWLYRLIGLAGKAIVGLFTGKKVFMKNRNNMSLEELWERLE